MPAEARPTVVSDAWNPGKKKTRWGTIIARIAAVAEQELWCGGQKLPLSSWLIAVPFGLKIVTVPKLFM